MPLTEQYWNCVSDVQLGIEVAIRGRCKDCLACLSRTMNVLGRVAEFGHDGSKFHECVDVPLVLCETCRPVYAEDVAAEVALAEVALTATDPRTLDALRKWVTIAKV